MTAVDESSADQPLEDVGSRPPAVRPPRNIVLLSDGTGNSAAKLNKTNVWWLYQALDLGGDDQIAFYDDGVGTSGIRPLRLLGGGFGWGLSRNVRDLYEFLCRHYRRDDNIYLFGFSRGAFTTRTIAGLIVRCGILDCSKAVPGRGGRRLQLNTHEGLKAGVKLAYRSYRRGYDRAPVANLYRRLRDLILRPVPAPDEFRGRYSFGEVRIRFIGVWDTVDAVGLPVDELSTMIDRIFYPHRFPDQNLSQRVDRACHAIAVDDERHTFHPVLWNENGSADSDRIRQVWFAGMHSNVGGGYPDDDLAFVPLQWMIGEAQGQGLRFDRDSVRDISHRAQPLGKMYNSRRGFGVYYRYNPRHVATLCDDQDAGVRITEPKIHRAVLERIAENTTGYAPAGLPTSYRIVDDQGVVSGLNPTTYEKTAAARSERAAVLTRAQDHVFWRRVLYYLFVLVTVALVLMPYYQPPIWGAEPEGWLESSLSSVLGWLPALLPSFLSGSAGWWTDAWTQSALWFLPLALVYGWLLWHSRWIDGNIHRLSEVAWWPIKRCPEPRPPTPEVGFFEGMASRLRRAALLQGLRRLTIRWVTPILTLAAVACLLLGAIYRVALHIPAVDGGICSQYLQRPPIPAAVGSEPVTLSFETSAACKDTRIDLLAGRRYQVEATAQGWEDAGHPADLGGLPILTRLRPTFVGAIPARRHIALPWFTLVAEIGRDSGDAFPVNRERFVLVPARNGRLYLYVNDAIDSFGQGWDTYYRNNSGTATVTVTPLD
ncbi:MAG TPA: DUF2235 domain-containing protein [Geminicoccaceae bacterium]|nr:DUF2235 domain-containing protein [Geminicoccaceae bacterium]